MTRLEGTYESASARKWCFHALLLLLAAALVGAMLRLSWVVEIPFVQYKNLLHAHSHVAMLGFGFTILGITLIVMLLRDRLHDPFYQKIFAINILAGWGMLLSFLYDGSGFASTLFSTIHLGSAYLFAWRFLREKEIQVNSLSSKFGRWAVYWMLISSIGLLSIGPIGLLLGKTSILYHASVQFFLHFQFNGWFTYGILAILVSLLEGREIKLPRYTFACLQASLVLTYALSITWSTPIPWLFYTNSLGVILQAGALAIMLYQIITRLGLDFKERGIAFWLLAGGIVSLMLKILIHLLVAVPLIAEISYTIRNFVIGFIHLTMLGSITMVIIAILINEDILRAEKWTNAGYLTLLGTFVVTEFLLFTQGLMLWMEMGFMPYYYNIMWVITTFMPIAVIFILTQFYNQNRFGRLASTSTSQLVVRAEQLNQ